MSGSNDFETRMIAEEHSGAPFLGCGAEATIVAANIIMNKAISSPGESSNEEETYPWQRKREVPS